MHHTSDIPLLLAHASAGDGHTLETDGLVHEAFLRMEGMSSIQWKDRQHVLAMAALTRLAQLNPRQAQVVECRFFIGRSIEETDEALAVYTP